MTDKERIAALRAALKKTVTARGALTLTPSEIDRAAGRLAAINSTALEALRLDDKAEITGEEESA